MADRTCSRCGTPVVTGAHFCSKCGHDVSGEQAALATAKIAAHHPSGATPPSEILEPLRRATLGEYDIAGELGRGGMATVFLAHDIALDRKVAIKVMNPSLLSGPGMAERFKREARTAAALSHPHIIPIYAVRETHQLLFFVMKYVEGRSLDSIIREQGRLPIPMVQAIAAQVGGALGYAHRRGIVHRDIKPANIMLDEEGWAVVTDFGIAKVADARGLTMTGVTIGTPSYMSPEQCASKEISGSSDQYSLGIVLYEMLAGKVPFESDSLMGIMWKHFNDPPPPILELRPDCTPPVADAVMRMLAKDPKDRWPLLEDAIAAIGQPPSAPDDPVRAQMRVLAAGSAGAMLRDHVHTPASPIPTGPASVSPDAPTMPSGAVGMPSGLRYAPPPTPAPRTGAPASIADAPTVASGDVPAVAVPHRVTATRVSAAPAAPAVPIPAAAPRRMGPIYAGIAAAAVVGAVGVWAILGRGGATPGDATEGTPPPAPVARVYLNPSTQSIAVGTQGELVATLLDSVSNLLTNRPMAWRSSDTTVVRLITGAGISVKFEGLRAGAAKVTAETEGKSTEATVTVTAVRAAVAIVTVEPIATLAPGDSARAVGAPKDAAGATLGGRAMTWTTDDPQVARMTNAGFVMAVGPGRATLTAASEGGVKGSTSVVVEVPPITSVTVTGASALEVGQTAQLGLVVQNARDRRVTDYQATWRSSDETVATVTAGTVTARKAGNVVIIASVEGRADTLRIAVTVPAPTRAAVSSVALSPTANLTLRTGDSSRLTARALDDRRQPLAEREMAWSSSNASVASVRDGMVTAHAPGEATITAESEGRRASLTVTVQRPPEPVAVESVAPPPPIATAPAMTVGELAAGAQHTCGVLSDGTAVCWGGNATGQLGGGVTGASVATPVAVPGTSRLQKIVAGGTHSCGLTGDGTAWCWGGNADGQLGNGKAEARVTAPVAVAGNRRFTQLAAGGSHTCGIDPSGAAWCWGRNNDGQLGNGSTRSQATAVAVARGLKFRALAAGEKHSCGIATDGSAYCWGDGFSEQLGTGGTEQQPEPVRADFRGDTLTSIAAGREANCALGRGGKVYCWGRGFSSTPREISTRERYRAVAVGDQFACALTASGAAACWGRNDKGQLGDGSGRNQTAPVAVAGGLQFRWLAAGNAHVCGVTEGGQVQCWGDNGRGELGTGATQASRTPVATQPIRR